MTFFATPFLDTNYGTNNPNYGSTGDPIGPTTIPVVLDPNFVALKRTVLAVQEIPYTQPSYERVGYIDVPEVPRHRGWMQQPYDTPEYPYTSLTSPSIPNASPAYSQQIQAAAHPVATYAQTGYTQALRSPGINEGY